MRKFGIGTVLALGGCVALVAGAIALATRDEGSAAVTQVAENDGDDNDGTPPASPEGTGDREGRFEHMGPPPGGPFMGGPGVPHPGDRPGFRGRLRFRHPSADDIKKRRSAFAKELGAELDKSTDEVLDALRAVFKKHLDEAVKEENLTQKQADRILKCYDTAKCGPGHRPFEP